MEEYAVLVIDAEVIRTNYLGIAEIYKGNSLEWSGFPTIEINVDESEKQALSALVMSQVLVQFLNYLSGKGFHLRSTLIRESTKEDGRRIVSYMFFLACPEGLEEILDSIQYENMNTGEKYSLPDITHAKRA